MTMAVSSYRYQRWSGGVGAAQAALRRIGGCVFCWAARGACEPFAGIWDRWKDPTGQWVKSCSILTTTQNSVTETVYDRMPVILDPDGYDGSIPA